MKIETKIIEPSFSLSAAAKTRMLSLWGEPLFYADWLRTMFIHYEVDAEILQRAVPFELDLDAGRAYVSLIAFTMRGMRPRIGGRAGALLFRPIATHEFLNVRVYVKHRGETGIYFLAEWLSNPFSVRLGPPLFGLPYRLGRMNYQHQHENGFMNGLVAAPDNSSRLEYRATMDKHGEFRPCERGSQTEFLLERYTAFTARNGKQRYFRVWHPPWPQMEVAIEVTDTSLLTKSWPWFKDASLIGANYSPGLKNLWMGRPHRLAE